MRCQRTDHCCRRCTHHHCRSRHCHHHHSRCCRSRHCHHHHSHCCRSRHCHHHHSRCCRSRHRCSLSRWCHHHRSGVTRRVLPQKRPPPMMRRSHHHRHHRCSRRMPIASSMSPWTPLLPHCTCACSPWKSLDYSIEWNLISYKCQHSGLYGVTGDHSNEARATVQ
jgi:hypothetical protein